MKIISRKNLVKAVTLSVLLAVPYGYAYADEYNSSMMGGWTENEYDNGIREFDDKKTEFVYTFADDDKVVTKGSGIAVENDRVVSITVKGLNDLNVTGNIVTGVTIQGKKIIGNDITIFNNRTIIKDGGNITVTANGNDASATGAGIFAGEGNIIELGDSVIQVTAAGSSSYAKAFGLTATNDNRVTFKEDEIVDGSNKRENVIKMGNGSITVSAEASGSNIIDKENSSVEAMGIIAANTGDTVLEQDGNKYDIPATGPMTIETGEVDITVTAKGGAKNNSTNAFGLRAANAGSKVTHGGGDITVSATNEEPLTTNGGTYAFGIVNSTNSQITKNGGGIIDVTAKGSNFVRAGGIYSGYNGGGKDTKVEVNGHVTIKSTTDMVAESANVSGVRNEVDNVGVWAERDASIVINDGADITVTANNTKGVEYTNANIFGVWSSVGGNIEINGTTTISTSGGKDIAVVAGTEDTIIDGENLRDQQKGAKNNITINYGANSVIDGDILSGWSGNVNIGTDATMNSRANNGLTFTGNALAGNGGVLNLNLTSGSTWTGRADDYQDAGVKYGIEFFNHKFEEKVTEKGTVNVNMASGAKWTLNGQSWISELDGNGTIVLDGNAIHIGKVADGSSSNFVVNLLPKGDLTESDMIYVKEGTDTAQNLVIGNYDYVLGNMEVGDRIRFATIADAGQGFSNGTVVDGSAGTFGSNVRVAGAGMYNVNFGVEYLQVGDSKNDTQNDEAYNGGTGNLETSNEDKDKPGDSYVESNYENGDNPYHAYLVRKATAPEDVSDAGKTVINMSRANYSNAIYMDRLNKRMGEARYINAEEDEGMWVRIRHDRIGKTDAYRSQNTMYELGYDKKQECDNGMRRVGFAVDYMHGDTGYSDIAGKGEIDRYGLWLYDTWLGDKGHYADYVAKWGHLDNEFDIYSELGERVTGDYSNNVFSISAEYGRKKDIGNDWYIEPQAQLQLARVTGADYVTSQNTRVSVEGINSLIGRAGFRLGKDFGEEKQSTVYIKADVLHEFLGDQDIRALDNTTSGWDTISYENKGTWYDVGFGFAAMMSKTSYAFLDLERSFGNDNDETYQINAGLRWTF